MSPEGDATQIPQPTAIPPPNKSRRRRVLCLRAVLLLVSITLSLLVAEGALRLFEHLNPEFNRYFFVLADHGETYVYDPDVGWRNAPGWKSDDPDIRIGINASGLRGPEIPIEKPPGMRRILVYGDSYAFGYGVSDDEIFSHYLDAILQQHHPPYQVLNAAVNAYGPDQAYLSLSKDGFDFSPDVVVLAFFIGNDFGDMLDTLLSGTAKPCFADESLRPSNVPVPFQVGSDLNKRLVRPKRLIGSSAMYRLMFFNAFPNEKAIEAMDWLNLCDVEGLHQPLFTGPRIDLAAAVVRGFHSLCNEHGCHFVLMPFGNFLEIEFDDAAPDFSHQMIERIPQLHLLDLDETFAERQLTKKMLTEGGTDNFHFGPFGHRQVAAILHEFLSQRQLIGAPDAASR
jgi:hypothetical protein